MAAEVARPPAPAAMGEVPQGYEYAFVDVPEEGGPGPGAYEPRIIKGGPQFSMRPKLIEGNSNSTPGPGTYEQVRTIGMDSLKSSIHGKLPASTATLDEPGPGHYDDHPNFGRPDDSTSLRPRVEYNPKSMQVPGPGTYTPRSTLGDAQKNTIKSRVEYNPRGSQVPAPDTYDLGTTIGKAVGTTWSRASGRDGTRAGNNVPGPGHYSGVIGKSRFYNKKTAQSTSFGASKTERFRSFIMRRRRVLVKKGSMTERGGTRPRPPSGSQTSR